MTLSEKGYTHNKVNHSLNVVDPQTGYHTNTIEGLRSYLKASLPEYSRRKKFLTDLYKSTYSYGAA